MADLAYLLEEEGLPVSSWPLFAAPLPYRSGTEMALAEQLGRFAHVIVDGPAAVAALAEWVRCAGSADSARRAGFVATNLSTVRALARFGWEARHVLPERADALLETLRSLSTDDDDVLWVGGSRIEGFRALLQQSPGRATLVRLVEDAAVDTPPMGADLVVVATNPSEAESLCDVLGEAGCPPAWHIVAGSAPTLATLQERGIPVAATASGPTTEALFDGVVRAWHSRHSARTSETARTSTT
jgi:uroporphyrinogen-III synthase